MKRGGLRKICAKPKRAQMHLSFGMIFSIILIIVFIVFAFYAIKKFIGLQQNIQIKKFAEDLQADVDKMWGSTQGSQTEEYALPDKIEAVCFEDRGYENLIFHSSKLIGGVMIEHLDIGKITKDESPFCIENIDGKVSIIIEKNYGEDRVTIVKP